MKRKHGHGPERSTNRDDASSCTSFSSSSGSGGGPMCCMTPPMHMYDDSTGLGNAVVPAVSQTSSPASGCFPTSCCSTAPRTHGQRKRHQHEITEIEQLLSDDLNNMTFEERDTVYEDVHGVGRLVDEEASPLFVESKLKEMEDQIQRIQSKEAYNRAHLISQTYVTDKAFRLMFLRSELFDARKAANRIVEHFRHKMQVFGFGKLARPLRWTDLTPQDQAVLQTGCFQVFPDCCDITGRVLIVNAFKYRGDTMKEDGNLARSFWYLCMQAFERASTESQRRGSVPVLYPLDTKLSNLQRELARESRNVAFDSMPGRVTGAHFCFSHPLMKRVFSVLLKAAPKDVRSRTKIHSGSHLECQYILNSFGIQKDTFPLDENGNLKRDLLQRRFNDLWDYEARKMQEDWLDRTARLERGEGITQPMENDVLMGRGSARQSYPGNMHFADMIEGHFERYQRVPQSDRTGKTAISAGILQDLHNTGARFLERTKDGKGLWVEVSDKIACAKIAMAFRNLARRVNVPKKESMERVEDGFMDVSMGRDD